MSTMYYSNTQKKREIGQTHALPKKEGGGYHFTWAMLPLEFCDFVTHAMFHSCVIDEYSKEYSMDEFTGIVRLAKSQSVEPGIV